MPMTCIFVQPPVRSADPNDLNIQADFFEISGIDMEVWL